MDIFKLGDKILALLEMVRLLHSFHFPVLRKGDFKIASGSRPHLKRGCIYSAVGVQRNYRQGICGYCVTWRSNYGKEILCFVSFRK